METNEKKTKENENRYRLFTIQSELSGGNSKGHQRLSRFYVKVIIAYIF